MPNRNGQRGGFARFALEGLDRMFLGNRAYDYRRDFWSGQGAMQGGIQSGLGAINPVLGLGARLWFNHQNRGQGYLGTNTNPLTPATPIPYTPPGRIPLNPVQRFNPGQIVPLAAAVKLTKSVNAPQGTAPTRVSPQSQQGRPSNAGGGMAGLTGIAAEMGGAQGAHSRGGYTGDAARALLASMISSPQYFQPFINNPSQY